MVLFYVVLGLCSGSMFLVDGGWVLEERGNSGGLYISQRQR
jgi:hypothetical protein